MEEEFSNFSPVLFIVVLFVSQGFVGAWLWLNWDEVTRFEAFILWLSGTSLAVLIYLGSLGMRRLGRHVKERHGRE